MEHSVEFLKIAEAAKARVEEISVEETIKRIESGANLIDVREEEGMRDK